MMNLCLASVWCRFIERGTLSPPQDTEAGAGAGSVTPGSGIDVLVVAAYVRPPTLQHA